VDLVGNQKSKLKSKGDSKSNSLRKGNRNRRKTEWKLKITDLKFENNCFFLLDLFVFEGLVNGTNRS
jgi:hypothetical protein